jgi:chromosome segregation ATPase
VQDLRKELEGLKGRYEACLQMVGEKEEEVEELRGDVGELKRIYRELVESKVGR